MSEDDSGMFPALLILVAALIDAGADNVRLADRFQKAAQDKRTEGQTNAAMALEILAGKADPDRYNAPLERSN
jgi:hypothetical protein